MLTWTDLLDAYEASIAALEVAVADHAVPDLPAWQPPDATPRSAPTPDDWDRFVHLQAREAHCQAAARDLLDEVGEELARTRRTAAAAHAYSQPGGTPLPG